MTPDPARRSRRGPRETAAAARAVAGRYFLKARDVLSSPNALAAAAAVAVLSLVLALYVVVAQINLTRCLARYGEQNARSSQARAAAAAEDRATDLEERKLAEAERARQAENDAALDRLLILMGRQPAGSAARRQLEAAFADLLAVRRASAKIRADNQFRRAGLAARRFNTDQRRQANPVPEPPSEMCGRKTPEAMAFAPFIWWLK